MKFLNQLKCVELFIKRTAFNFTSSYEEKSFERRRKPRKSLNRETSKTYVNYKVQKRNIDKSHLSRRNSIDSTNSLRMGNDYEKRKRRTFLLGDKKSERMKYVSKNRNAKKINYDVTSSDNYELFCKIYTMMVVAPISQDISQTNSRFRTVYKNPHCAACNGIQMNLTSCFQGSLQGNKIKTQNQLTLFVYNKTTL